MAKFGIALPPGLEGGFGLAFGVRHRQARHRDVVDRGELDARAAAEQRQRVPVEPDAVQGQPHSEMVVHLDMGDAQIVRKPAAKAGQRDQATAERCRLALDQPAPRPGVGADQKHQQDQRHQRKRRHDDQARDPEHDAADASGLPWRLLGHQNVSPRPI